MGLGYLWVIAAIVVIAVLSKRGKNRVPLSIVTEQEVLEALKGGDKTLAIKYYRAINSCGLTEARQAIGAMNKELQQTH